MDDKGDNTFISSMSLRMVLALFPPHVCVTSVVFLVGGLDGRVGF